MAWDAGAVDVELRSLAGSALDALSHFADPQNHVAKGRHQGQALQVADEKMNLGSLVDLTLFGLYHTDGGGVAHPVSNRIEALRFGCFEGKTWSQPVLVGDLLLVRNGQEMAAFRLPLAGG